MMSSNTKGWIAFGVVTAAAVVLMLVILPWLGVPSPWSLLVGGGLYALGVTGISRRYPLTSNRTGAHRR